ncbi:ABC transporter permease [Promicromonospora thailandica]|uniref:ABC-2 type transport system permease protein n=1 Tax=Promicromonospora thailandica TaxID=765201 RepID=A0A9X2JWV5_9MICO|nr:ABC transporter permease [Promicromonospora thailandica]MCP2263494.1 ABC-2 type transport system permease protein [Promicromonospora thailandica]BFF19332.1 ABC transporter permease [Promicromonospora thailandica]
MTTTGRTEARRAAVRAGLSRGWLETKYSLAEPADVVWYLAFPVIYAVVLLFMRGSTVPGTDFALGAMVLPSLVGMSIAFGGLTGAASTIAVDREDGTLLRAKATPNGMIGYLVGKILMFTLTAAVSLVALVIPAFTVAGDLRLDARTWVLLVLIFVVGMVATVPASVALGSLFKTSAQTGLLFLASTALIIPSGIFYPITALPTWLQWVGQAFPYYWLGLGARSAMLPEAMVVAEIGGSWRTAEMFVVLGIWAVVGMVLAPIVLRRMARRESGSTVAAARERFMAKGY